MSFKIQKEFIIFLLFILSVPAMAEWKKVPGVFGPIWNWEGDKLQVLIKKSTPLEFSSMDLNQFAAEVYKTKAEDLKNFNITEWKKLKEENSKLIYIASGTYLSVDKKLVYWVEIFKEKEKTLSQCLMTSSSEVSKEKINEGIKICQE